VFGAVEGSQLGRNTEIENRRVLVVVPGPTTEDKIMAKAVTYTIKSKLRKRAIQVIIENAKFIGTVLPDVASFFDENAHEIARITVKNGNKIPTVFDPPIVWHVDKISGLKATMTPGAK